MTREEEPGSNQNQLETKDLLDLSAKYGIVFFDGLCGLCNTSVDWVLLHDPEARHRFSPLQGKAAALVLSPRELADLDTIVLLKNRRTFRRSDAIAEILVELPGAWRALGRVLKMIPRPLRDLGYRVVAKLRYQVFGKKDFCRIPSKEERSRFLD